MSYPSSLDLAFGSEKFTSDPFSHLSFSKGDRSLPTTQEELYQLAQNGLAHFALFGAGNTLDLSDGERIPIMVVESLPENLKGIVILDPEDESVTSHTYTVTTDPLVITVNSVPENAKGAYIILKQAVY